MRAHAEWVLKTSWLVYPLTQWLKLPEVWRVRILLPAVLVSSVSSVGYLLLAPAKPHVSVSVAQTAEPATSSVKVLPALSSVALLELTQHLQNSEINQRHGQFNLSFTSKWQPFAEFSNQIMQSNLAPLSYRMQWQPRSVATLPATKKEFNVQLQLAPGVYRKPEDEVIRWLPQANTSDKVTTLNTLQCPAPPLPDFTLQASWPSRGYIQVLLNGRSERIEINQLLGKSWQLLRIGSDSLGFSWHNAGSACHKEKTITVAI